MDTKNKISTKALVMAALLTAIVVVLQYMGAFIKFGPFSISLVLVPIVIGAATCGPMVGAWLGFIFGFVVLISGDAGVFLAINPLGTIATVLLKGIACGLCSAFVYKWLSRFNKYIAVAVSAIVCPVVNTGVFLIGCLLFFMEAVSQWAGGGNVFNYMIVGLVGVNFLIELVINVVLSPVIVRILSIRKTN